MPWCQVDPICQLYYEFATTTTGAAAAPTTPQHQRTGKPVLLVIAPLFGDVLCPSVQAYMNDDQLKSKFDVLAFDPRGHGRTMAEPSPKQDIWTQPGDALVLLNRLGISAAHVVGSHAITSDCALRMAVLAPECCISLTLCGVNNQEDTPFIRQALSQVFQHLVNSDELDDWYEGLIASLFLDYGHDLDSESMDEYAGIFLRRYNPRRSVNGFIAAAWWFSRTSISDEDLKAIPTPITILYGSEDVLYPDGPTQLAKTLGNRPPTLICLSGAPHNVFATRFEDVKEHLVHLTCLAPSKPTYTTSTSLPPSPSPSTSSSTSVSSSSFSSCCDHLVHRLTKSHLTPTLNEVLPLSIPFQRLVAIGQQSFEVVLPTDLLGRDPLQSGSFSLMSDERQKEVLEEIDEVVEAPPPDFFVPGSDEVEKWECEEGKWRGQVTKFTERFTDRM